MRLLIVTSVLLFALCDHLVSGTRLTISNNCYPISIWPGILSSAGAPKLSTTGFELKPGESRTIDVPRPWNGRIWARAHCHHEGGNLICKTGQCGGVACNEAGGVPPVTLVEIEMKANGGQDFYDISLVDGFNLPVTLIPRGGHGDCRQLSCPKNINLVCPQELVIKDNNYPVGCKSACLAWNRPEHCCTGAHNTADTCPPFSYSQLFKDQCPQAYSYAYDDRSSLFTCFGSPDYEIKFCG